MIWCNLIAKKVVKTAKAVEVKNLTWQYSDTTRPALNNISFDIEENTFTGICGPNESGKTTLVSCIKGLIPNKFNGIMQGEVKVFGQDVSKMSTQELARYVGFVFADPEAQFTSMSVEEELAFGMENIGLGIKEIEERIRWVAEITMITDLLEKPPYEISGGQKQRVAIASALVVQPKIIILDEPTSMLDPFGKDAVFEICQKMKDELKMTIIMIEHAIDRLARLSDMMMLIYDGEIKKYSEPEEFFDNMQDIIDYGLNPPDPMLFLDRLRRAGLYRGKMKTGLSEVLAIARSVLGKEGGVV